MTRSDEIDSVLKIFGLISGDAFAVFNSDKRVIVIRHIRGAVKICCNFTADADHFKIFLICVSESIKRRRNCLALGGADFCRHSLERFERLFKKLQSVFITANMNWELGIKQFHFGMALQKTQRGNFGVGFADK